MKIRFVRSSRVAIAFSALALAAVAVPSAGAAPTTSAAASGVNISGHPYWPGQDIVRGVALTHPTGGAQPGGYVLDSWGGVHNFGGAPFLPSSHYTPNNPTSHSLALEGGDAAGTTMNASAKTWPFPGGIGGTTDTFQTCDQSRNFGIAVRGISLDPAVSGGKFNLNGATIDGWGGVHPLCTNTTTINLSGAPYWPGWQIVHGIALLGGGIGGFTLDGYGGVHAWGKAKVTTPPDAYWGARPGVRAWDIARGVAIDGTGTTTTAGNGVVVDGWGGLHTFTYNTLP